MVGRVGVEPTTPGLKVRYGTIRDRPPMSIWYWFTDWWLHQGASRTIVVHYRGCQIGCQLSFKREADPWAQGHGHNRW